MNSELLYIIASIVGVAMAVLGLYLTRRDKRDQRIVNYTKLADALDNNTAAQEKQTELIQAVVATQNHHSIVLARHDERLSNLEKAKD